MLEVVLLVTALVNLATAVVNYRNGRRNSNGRNLK